MRQWRSTAAADVGRDTGASVVAALAGMVDGLGTRGFASGLLAALHPLLPAASWSVYRTGMPGGPRLYMSASFGIPDTTRDCWGAYLSGPCRDDRSWGRHGEAVPAGAAGTPSRHLRHITAQEVAGDHRARVYEAHGMAERLSIFEHEAQSGVFAVNFYRHQHQRPFDDAQIGAFEAVAPALLALARKHIALTGGAQGAADLTAREPSGQALAPCALREKLLALHAGLTEREIDVCVRLLQGMTQEGIARDLDLSVPTVKTYRNRAFARLGGIHFRNELFALVL
ncbi:MAG: LuxR family transcriptional regulator, partial [Rhodoferax sp.]|nr:LuxR family transcriptional regulator [Rhodoferax sp.]